MQSAPRAVADHLTEVLALVAPLPAVRVPVVDAADHVLAEDVHAPEALPRWDNSAMDGYAVRADDVAAASDAAPVRLTVLADLPAGSAAEPVVAPGTAARIMTGAPVPPGADSVVPVERTDAGTDVVAVRAPAVLGAHVRRAGEDVVAGELVLARGTLLGPTQVAAAASVGCGDVVVHRRPRVAVLSTGSELVVPGTPVTRGQIPDSNSFLLAAAVRTAGCDVVRVGAVPDDADALRAALDEQDGAVDLVVTSGGVSMGAYDVVKEVLAGEAGMSFVAVAMQPGKPQGLGRLRRGTPILALPGNPVSAFVSFEVFVRPALRVLRGLAPGGDDETAIALEGWSSPPGREQYMPVTLRGTARRGDGPTVAGVRPAVRGGSGSHLVAGLARAEALAVVAADVERVEPGDRVRLMRAQR
ncbi:molybdopterin molybdotransferase MoeA [Actinotalea ferrariae]|uniref:molybdopterin molybdotransferase MoeA n=1 Tax=Actinotalea ferrariae TaxID=1386098 RepID=UPI001C8C6942|nr:gephyrin-like molybdotransferase Glp [Actinotalea ferrariae]MBX9246780.1 molybdopterin molybdotransferase MoeA [Actinotalea ferrariae]